jgi:hypothetical protein
MGKVFYVYRVELELCLLQAYACFCSELLSGFQNEPGGNLPIEEIFLLRSVNVENFCTFCV